MLPNDYNILRADRTNGCRGGGVALIYKNCLKIKCKERSNCLQFESMACTLTYNNSVIDIIIVYRPPPTQRNQLHTNEFLEEWTEFLSHHTSTTAGLVVVGDLNIHMDNASHSHTKAMTQILQSNGLQQHVHEPTHCGGHTLDVIMSRDNDTLVSNVQVNDIGLCDDNGTLINDHYAIICDLTKLKSCQVQQKSVSYRKFKDINLERFKEDIQRSSVLSNVSGSANELMDRYVSGIKILLEFHAPLIQRTITPRQNAPWYTEEIRNSKRKRRSLERRWRHSKSDVDKVQYRNQCAILAKQLSDTKAVYYSTKIHDCAGNPKLLHKLTDKLIVGQHQHQLPSSDDDVHLANKFSHFFDDKINVIRNRFQLNSSALEESFSGENLENIRPATDEEVKALILSYSNKSCELDPIPTWLLKICINELLPILTAVINSSLSTGEFPEQCKHAIVRPLLKKDNLDPDELKNYRPVSNLHFISKIIEKLVVQRLEDHLCKYSMFDPLQSAYRSGYSTETALVKINNDIVSSLDGGQCVILASLDLSSAFDTVDHAIFLRRLQDMYGICNTFQKWFDSYLTNRQPRVCINTSFSNPRYLKCGVPQGSVLGARIYTMYVRPMSEIINRHNVSYHSYADDSQLYIQCDNNEESIRCAITRLEQCISDICEWMSGNSLKINQDKTEFIIFSCKSDQYNHLSLNVGSEIIHPSKSVKILGVTLDFNMNMQQDVVNTCRSSYMHIRKINSIRKYLSKESTLTLVNATVLMRLDYCNSLYTGLPQKTLHKLQLVQNAAARLITQTPRHYHISPILKELNWLQVTQRCQYKILVITFKVLHNEAPAYIANLFNWYTPARTLRSASTTSLVPNKNKTVMLGRRLIDTTSAALWNNLPNDIKFARNIIHFKKLLRPFITSNF